MLRSRGCLRHLLRIPARHHRSNSQRESRRGSRGHLALGIQHRGPVGAPARRGGQLGHLDDVDDWFDLAEYGLERRVCTDGGPGAVDVHRGGGFD